MTQNEHSLCDLDETYENILLNKSRIRSQPNYQTKKNNHRYVCFYPTMKK